MAQGRRGYRLVAGSGKAARMLAESADRDGVLAVLDALASGVLAIPDADPDGTRLTLYRNGMVAGQSDYPGVLAVQLRAMPERPAPPTPTDDDPLGLFGPDGSEDGPAPAAHTFNDATIAPSSAAAWQPLVDMGFKGRATTLAALKALRLMRERGRDWSRGVNQASFNDHAADIALARTLDPAAFNAQTGTAMRVSKDLPLAPGALAALLCEADAHDYDWDDFARKLAAPPKRGPLARAVRALRRYRQPGALKRNLRRQELILDGLFAAYLGAPEEVPLDFDDGAQVKALPWER